ncbi:hypothetical protein SAMN05421505_11631 [Sinosporangium album]|uniref:Uncharacterized protein n=1 Tax=Sinosporangium album TaxID=504805 RepID=A0A1G8CIV3_9ACTN|nr:hypothetical protein [Sinosporangium album]SDH45387.1 hypothetical protein SAMN05421505_11631 [Sinosporangium album]
MASLLLAVLWGFSVFAGWGLEAFCPIEKRDGGCFARLGVVAAVSSLFAMVAGCCTAAAWLAPSVRREVARFRVAIGVAIAAWVAAEGTLFIGGMLIQ